MKTFKTAKIVLLIYAIIFVWSAVSPVDRSVWYVEAVTSLIPVAILAILFWRGVRLSPVAYVLMSIFPIMHIIGAHYTFANVPFGWFDNLFGFGRDMYDRVAHFTVGFYAYGIAEMSLQRKATNSLFFALSYALFSIMALAAAYEIFEWFYAVTSDPSSGLAVLGSQGDIWDTQKDMLMDTLGAVVAVILYAITEKRPEELKEDIV